MDLDTVPSLSSKTTLKNGKLNIPKTHATFLRNFSIIYVIYDIFFILCTKRG